LNGAFSRKYTVDVANSPSFEDEAVKKFFVPTSRSVRR
jgi:hypothetical protein